MNNNVEEIKSRLNIVDVVGEYVRLTKAGANWKGLCPFHHEKTPSFMVNEEKQIFHCFGCAKGGDIFTFIEEIESMDFREALKLLAEKAGVELGEYKSQNTDAKKRVLSAIELATKFYETQLWKSSGGKKILQYLHDRGLEDESIKKFRLGYAPAGWRNILKFLTERGYTLEEIFKTGLLVEKQQGTNDKKQDHSNSGHLSHATENYYDRFRDRIMFPIQDAFGNVIGYSARVAPGGDESQAKYVNTPETIVYHKSNILYGLSQAKNAIKKKNYVLIVEGNMDVIASSQAGIENTVAVSGTAMTQEHIAIIKRYTQNVAMLFDMDSAGQLAAGRSADLCFENGMNVKIITLSDSKDAADAVKKDPKILAEAMKKSKDAVEYFFERVLLKYDKNTAEGKNKIAKEILSHVAHIENKISKDYWVKKIAHELDVEESAISDVLKSATVGARGQRNVQISSGDEEIAGFQKRSDAIRDHLAGVILSSKEIWREMAESKRVLFQGDAVIGRILENGEKTGFSFDAMLEKIEDREFLEKLRKIYFDAKYKFAKDSVVEYSQEDLKRLADEYLTQYLRELQKEKLHAIIREIEKAEQKGDKDALAKLMCEFTKLSQETLQ